MKDFVDHALEASALGSLLCGKGQADYLLPRLGEGDFASEVNRAVFSAMARCALKRRPSDVPMVAAELEADGRTAAIAALPQIVESAGSHRHAEHYVDRVRDLGAMRRLATLDMHRLVEGSDGPTEAISAARQAVDEIARGRQTGRLVSGLDIARSTFNRLEEAKKRGAGPQGIETGFYDLDHTLSGLRAGCLYVLAARPGQGKTALGLVIAMHVAGRRQRVLFFSLEMSAEQLGDRALSAEGRISTSDVSRGDLDDDGWAKASRALGRIGEMALYVDDRAALPISELVATAKSVHAEKPIGLVVVDYLQLVRGSARRRESREQEVAEVCRELKGLSKDLGGPVLALAQLNRETDKREDKRPRLSDLRESGEIEQAADVVAMLYREHAYDESKDPYEAELILQKNRHGPRGTIELRWSPEWVRFDSAVVSR